MSRSQPQCLRTSASPCACGRFRRAAQRDGGSPGDFVGGRCNRAGSSVASLHHVDHVDDRCRSRRQARVSTRAQVGRRRRQTTTVCDTSMTCGEEWCGEIGTPKYLRPSGNVRAGYRSPTASGAGRHAAWSSTMEKDGRLSASRRRRGGGAVRLSRRLRVTGCLDQTGRIRRDRPVVPVKGAGARLPLLRPVSRRRWRVCHRTAEGRLSRHLLRVAQGIVLVEEASICNLPVLNEGIAEAAVLPPCPHQRLLQ